MIPAFLFIFMGLVSQYHIRIPDSIPAESMAVKEILPMENQTTVYDTGTVYIIFPEYSDVGLVCETRPSKSDESVTWCSGAAFQHDISLGFSHGNIDGDHAVDGVLYESPYNKDSFAAFTFANGRFSFGFDDPSGAIREAAEKGGSGFMQFGLIRDGEIDEKMYSSYYRDLEPRHALGMIEPGHYLLLSVQGRKEEDSRGTMLQRVAEMMKERGVTQALNLDGGNTMALMFRGRMLNKEAKYQNRRFVRSVPSLIGIGKTEIPQN